MADALPEEQVDGGLLAEHVVGFGRLLRRAGLPADPARTRDFVRALALLGVARKRDIKAAARAVFTRRREERPLCDVAFELFWRRRGTASEVSARLPRIRQDAARPGGVEIGDGLTVADELQLLTPMDPRSAGMREQLRHVDFAELTPAEARDAEAMLAELRPRLPRRRARRPVLAAGGGRPAARRMLRGALASGGEVLRWRSLGRASRARPIVLVCDISGSMERYSRFLLRFGHALQRSGAPVEVFVFGTRLTRITRQLRQRSANAALRQVADKVVDWNGGTRIGESLRELNRRWVRRTIRSGAVVLVVSDGWERGDPELLAREMATLRRSCHRLLWLDPLASRPAFEPITAGLRAALPYADALVPCATVASLAELGDRLGEL
jgi:hypothetical protein